jgi:hypothetical protein
MRTKTLTVSGVPLEIHVFLVCRRRRNDFIFDRIGCLADALLCSSNFEGNGLVRGGACGCGYPPSSQGQLTRPTVQKDS